LQKESVSSLADPGRKIRITVGPVQVEAELKGNRTAQEVYAALPLDAPVNTWGEEFYFKIDGVKDYRERATNRVSLACPYPGGRTTRRGMTRRRPSRSDPTACRDPPSLGQPRRYPERTGSSVNRNASAAREWSSAVPHVAPSGFLGYSARMTFRTTGRSGSRLHWLRRFGRGLALVAQLHVVLVPLSEGREERALGPNVETPRTMPHVGHRPDVCPACTLASILGHIDEPPALDDAVVSAVAEIEPAFARTFAPSARARSNSSRAPPHSA